MRGSGDTEQTHGENRRKKTFTDILNLHCDLDLQCSNPILPQETRAYDAVLSNQIWLQTDQRFRRYNRNSNVLIIEPLAVTLTLNTVNQFLCMTDNAA